MARSYRARKQTIAKDVRRTIALSGPGVDSEQLLADIIAQWGGTGNLARDIKKSFDQSPDGSMIKQRFLEMVQRLIINNTMHDLTKNVDPSEFTDEELAQVAEVYVKRVAAGDEAGEVSGGVDQRKAARQESGDGLGPADEPEFDPLDDWDED